MTVSWLAVLLAEVAVFVYGITAIILPDIVLGPSFEKFSGQSLASVVSNDPKIAAYISLSGRLIGGYNVAFGIFGIFIVWKGFRRGESWCWTALLNGNT